MRHIKNKILLMKAIAYDILVDKMNINSVVFLIQEEARKLNNDIFNYEFKRKHLYPYSEEVEKDIIQLMSEGYIEENGDKYKITEKAKEYVRNNQRRFFNYDVDTFVKYHLYINKDKSIFKLSEKINSEYNIVRVNENYAITKVIEDNIYKPEECKKDYGEIERKNKIKKRVLMENDDILMERLKNFKKTNEEIKEG